MGARGPGAKPVKVKRKTAAQMIDRSQTWLPGISRPRG